MFCEHTGVRVGGVFKSEISLKTDIQKTFK